VFRTINTTLVSFAAELLLQSQHPDDDHISAVSALHSLVINKDKKRSDAAVDQICASIGQVGLQACSDATLLDQRVLFLFLNLRE